MEYLEGETLAARVARSPLPFDEAIGIGVDPLFHPLRGNNKTFEQLLADIRAAAG
jgi:hypothetical protein